MSREITGATAGHGAYSDPWMWTNSGKEFHFLDPKEDQIDIHDIATALAKIPRFAGQGDINYSVADHCVNLVDFMLGLGGPVDNKNNILLGTLLHDASEAYLCDIPSPLKRVLPDYQAIEATVQKVIFKKFGIKDDQQFNEQCSYWDGRIVADEAKCCFITSPPTWVQERQPINIRIHVSSDWEEARDNYLDVFHDLWESLHGSV